MSESANMDTIISLTCKNCEQEKTSDQFYLDSRTGKRRVNACKPCAKEIQKHRREVKKMQENSVAQQRVIDKEYASWCRQMHDLVVIKKATKENIETMRVEMQNMLEQLTFIEEYVTNNKIAIKITMQNEHTEGDRFMVENVVKSKISDVLSSQFGIIGVIPPMIQHKYIPEKLMVFSYTNNDRHFTNQEVGLIRQEIRNMENPCIHRVV